MEFNEIFKAELSKRGIAGGLADYIVSWYENAEIEALPLSAEFDESKHPRAKDGKFASSPGGGEPKVTREEIDDDFARRIETMGDLGEMRELERQRRGRSGTRERGGEPEVTRKEIDDDFASRIETMDDLGEMRELERRRKGRSGTRRRDGSSRHGGEPEGKSVNLDEINDTIKKANVELENLFNVPFFESPEAYAKRKEKVNQLRDEIDELYERKWRALKKGHGDEKRRLSDVLPTQQPKPAGKSWLERLEKARDESDEEAIINVADENGDVHEFTPEELEAEIRKHSK